MTYQEKLDLLYGVKHDIEAADLSKIDAVEETLNKAFILLEELEKAWAALEFISTKSTFLPSTTDHSEQEDYISMVRKAREALNS